jgi:uncharacterized protein
MPIFETRLLEGDCLYDGTQLAPHWIYRRTGKLGDALVAFEGPADVSLDHMVDLEDVARRAPIASARMLHFIGEWFVDSLQVGVLLQHLFVNEVYEELLERGIRNLRRRGNDIYFEDRKLSVSIATRSPVSVLIHAAFNITSEGTPIPTSNLGEMGVEVRPFAQAILDRFSRDYAIWETARVKVIPR